MMPHSAGCPSRPHDQRAAGKESRGKLCAIYYRVTKGVFEWHLCRQAVKHWQEDGSRQRHPGIDGGCDEDEGSLATPDS